MNRKKLAADGPEFSRMVYGTWRILDTCPTAQEINRRLHSCVELGITTFDTAEIYGLYAVEEQLGAALRLSAGLRDKIEIVTKAGRFVSHDLRLVVHHLLSEHITATDWNNVFSTAGVNSATPLTIKAKSCSISEDGIVVFVIQILIRGRRLVRWHGGIDPPLFEFDERDFQGFSELTKR